MTTFSLNPDSAPGSDGFTGHFFRRYWHKLGPEITKAATSFFTSRKLLKSFNHTLIALIPKQKIIQEMNQVRPISLSNFIYKIFSKIIVNKLQPIMGTIISEN
ncbi:reverse transcriptase [Canna indica]|uniref:Reverse transcriptase n=1 Tax=Canna indica TaxID=4628 RepID=A0AAQ3QTT6_9LILI|nr:reverse transcriptase [Canna indica]